MVNLPFVVCEPWLLSALWLGGGTGGAAAVGVDVREPGGMWFVVPTEDEPLLVLERLSPKAGPASLLSQSGTRPLGMLVRLFFFTGLTGAIIRDCH